MQHKDAVLYQEEQGIGLITLNRPRALNALSMELLQRLSLILDQAQASESVRALIVTGAGAVAFSAGADIKYLNQATPLAVGDFARLAIAVNHKIETLGKSRNRGHQWIRLRWRPGIGGVVHDPSCGPYGHAGPS